MTSARILLVTAEPMVARLASASLRVAGYQTEVARGRAEALDRVERMRPDLLVVDLGGDGASVGREPRMGYVADAPILFLAEAAEAAGATMALTVGGDKYLANPFSLDDLTAHVRALLRRAAGPGPHPEAVLRFADLELDEDTLDVRRNGRTLGLAPRERKILRHLLMNAGRAVSRTQIVEHVWPYNHGGHRRGLDVHVCNLRREINKAGRPLIETLYGIGYCLRDPQGVK